MARNVYCIAIEFYDEAEDDLKAKFQQMQLVHRVATYVRQYRLVRSVQELCSPEVAKQIEEAEETDDADVRP